jgi:hypothetical protein
MGWSQDQNMKLACKTLEVFQNLNTSFVRENCVLVYVVAYMTRISQK